MEVCILHLIGGLCGGLRHGSDGAGSESAVWGGREPGLGLVVLLLALAPGMWLVTRSMNGTHGPGGAGGAGAGAVARHGGSVATAAMEMEMETVGDASAVGGAAGAGGAGCSG